MNFGQAIEILKDGRRVARAGWNGKGMWLELQRGLLPPVWSARQLVGGVDQSLFDRAEPGTSTCMPTIIMWTADCSYVIGWLASQTDMMAEDWVEVEK